jgi:hypothetical protein
MEAAADDLAALVDPVSLSDWDAPSVARLVEAHARIRRVTGRLDGVRYTLLPRIEDEGSWRAGGMSRTFTSWLRVREGVSAGTARRDVMTARRLVTALPETRARLVAGVLGGDHARVMSEVAPTSETRQDALAWLVDTRSGEPTTPEQFVHTVPVDFPDPGQDPDGAGTRELVTAVLEAAVADGTLVTGEGLVLREATVLNADQFRVVARRFATVTDPDTDEVEDDRAARGEFLDLSKTLGGYHVAGFLTDEHGLLVTTALTAVMGAPSAEDARTPGQRRAQALADVARVVLDTNQASPGAAIAPHLNVTVSWTELVTQVTRTREGLCLTCGQSTRGRAGSTMAGSGTAGSTAPDGMVGDGLVGDGMVGRDLVGSAATGNGTTGNGTTGNGTTGSGTTGSGTVRGGVSGGGVPGGPAGSGIAGTATVSGLLPGLLSAGGPVFTETRDRVPRAVLRRLACDSAVTRIVFGPDGAVLDVGRAQRTVTGQMRRAVIARDQHCVYPGCDQPPSRCEVHHAVTHWADGGGTSVANSALLCWYHHQLVDTRGITMHWTGTPTTTDTTTTDTDTATNGTAARARVGALVETGWAFTDANGHRIRPPQAIEPAPLSDAQAA